MGNKGLSDDKLRKLGTYYQQILKDTTLSVSQKAIHVKAILQHHLESQTVARITILIAT